MPAFLLLRLDAPMMSFGHNIVDAHGKTAPFPGRSMLAGLLGNALGYDHRDMDQLDRLQALIHHAVRRDCGGSQMQDYQTVDLGQKFLLDPLAWTTWGHLDERTSNVSEETHQRHRDYLVDSVFTVALTLVPTREARFLDTLAAALQKPARPLFLGRKCCLPASPIFLQCTEAPSLLEALQKAPTSRSDKSRFVWWPAGEDPERERSASPFYITDERDWKNQIHVGQHLMFGDFLCEPKN